MENKNDEGGEEIIPSQNSIWVRVKKSDKGGIRVKSEPPIENGGSNGGSIFPNHLIGVKKVRFDFGIGGSRNFGGLSG